jgi:hypothetical protein
LTAAPLESRRTPLPPEAELAVRLKSGMCRQPRAFDGVPVRREEGARMTPYERYSLVLQVVVAIAAFVTLAFLYRQIKVMVDQLVATQHSSRAQVTLGIVELLQSREARQSREHVRRQLSKMPQEEWSEEDRKHASLVCANYDVAAALLLANLAPTDLFVLNWGPSIRHCYGVLRPYIENLRAQPGADPRYWSNFAWLYDRSMQMVEGPAATEQGTSGRASGQETEKAPKT